MAVPWVMAPTDELTILPTAVEGVELTPMHDGSQLTRSLIVSVQGILPLVTTLVDS